jgi:hypothetical protein
MEHHAFERRFTPCAEFPNDNEDLHHGAIWACMELGREASCELPRPYPPPAAVLEATASAAVLEEPQPRPLPSIATPAGSAEEIVSLLTIDERDEHGEREADVSSPSWPLVSHRPLGPSPAVEALEDGLAAVMASDDVDPDGLAEDAEPIEIVDELSFDDALDDLPAVLEAAEPASDEASAGLVSERAPADPFAQLVAALEDVARALGAGDEGVACLDALFGRSRIEAIAAGDRAVEALVAGGVIARGARGLTRSGPFTAKVLAWQGILRGESEDFALPDGGALEPLDEWAADLLMRVVGPPARADGIRRDLRRRGIAAFGLVAEAA